MKTWFLSNAMVLALLWPANLHAQEPTLDWQRGLLLVRVGVPGDLRSPNREMARIKAERHALERGEAQLKGALDSVPRVPGFGAARVSEGEWQFAVTQVDYGMDGSVVVEMGLPLDSLRTRFGDPDPMVAGDAKGPAAVIVDARGLKLRPAIGYGISDGSSQYRGPSVFFADEDIARQDARIGKEATILVATAVREGVIGVEAGALATLLENRPLVVVLWKQDKVSGAK